MLHWVIGDSVACGASINLRLTEIDALQLPYKILSAALVETGEGLVEEHKFGPRSIENSWAFGVSNLGIRVMVEIEQRVSAQAMSGGARPPGSG